MSLPYSYGRVTDAPYWLSVRELYLEDWVEDALDLADQLGGRDSNELHAEALVRRDGQTWQVRDWLTVEALTDEVGSGFDEVLETIGADCQRLSEMFEWDNHEPTLVTILPKAFYQPWMPGRWGYFVDKVPCDKVCVPGHLLSEPDIFQRTLRHEFMHGITLNLAAGHAPKWLEEAMSTLVEGRLSKDSWHHFQQNPRAWLNPLHLIGALSVDARDEANLDAIIRGYDQSSFIGLFLYNHGSHSKLAEMLRVLGDESFASNLGLQVLGRTRADNALRHVFHISEDELFAQTLTWIHEHPPPEPPF